MREDQVKDVESLDKAVLQAQLVALDEQLRLAVNQMAVLGNDIEETDRGIAVSKAKIEQLRRKLKRK